MRKKLVKTKITLIFVIFIVGSTLLLHPVVSSEENPGPFFSLTILAPNTSTAQYQMTTLIADQLPKIGIEVEELDITGWSEISSRTWGHPGPYPIPVHAEGGYDILFVGWSGGLDWDPTFLYDSSAITPNGDNIYQYSNREMDNAIGNYTEAVLFSEKIKWLNVIQEILYNDLPSIPIIYPKSVYPHHENLTGWDSLLWDAEAQPMSNWEINGKTTFSYATPVDFENFQIHLLESPYDKMWLHQIYNGLIERDPEYENTYVSWATESYYSTDGLTYHVTIEEEAKWADGTSVTVDDVIYNYQLLLTPGYAGGSNHYCTNLWNNDSITKISDKEFEITFLDFYTFQDNNVAIDLIPKHIWESIDPADHEATATDWAKNQPEKIFGFGPYKLAEYNETNKFIHLTKNTYFDEIFTQEPKFDDIYFKFYESKEDALTALASGEVNMVDSQFHPQLDELAIPGATYSLTRDPGVKEIAVNMYHPYVGTGELCPIASTESAKHIRKAISHMVPRELIISDILDGLGAPGVTACPNTAIGYNETLEPYAYDENLARYHMAQAGYDLEYTPPGNGTTTVSGLPLFTTSLTVLASLSFSVVIVIGSRKRTKRRGP